jgi:hypothetical protein
VHFSFFTFFSVSRHIPVQREFVSHFSCFSVFLAKVHVLQCVFLIFHDFQFSRHMPGPTVMHFSFFNFFKVSRPIPDPTACVSHFPSFCVFLAIFQVKQFLCVIFHVFHFFSPYSRSYSVYFSFFTFFTLSIFQVLPCVFLILHVFQCFLRYSRFYHVSFSFSTFSVLLPCSRSYSMHFIVFYFFSVSRHLLGPTVFVSHFVHFPLFSQ